MSSTTRVETNKHTDNAKNQRLTIRKPEMGVSRGLMGGGGGGMKREGGGWDLGFGKIGEFETGTGFRRVFVTGPVAVRWTGRYLRLVGLALSHRLLSPGGEGGRLFNSEQGSGMWIQWILKGGLNSKGD